MILEWSLQRRFGGGFGVERFTVLRDAGVLGTFEFGP